MLEKITLKSKVTLKELRKFSGLTQEEFSGKVGEPLSTYRRYESQPESMPVGTLFKICAVFGVSPSNINIENGVDK